MKGRKEDRGMIKKSSTEQEEDGEEADPEGRTTSEMIGEPDSKSTPPREKLCSLEEENAFCTALCFLSSHWSDFRLQSKIQTCIKHKAQA